MATKPGAAGWSSPVARQAHNLKVTGSNPVPASTTKKGARKSRAPFAFDEIQVLRTEAVAAIDIIVEVKPPD